MRHGTRAWFAGLALLSTTIPAFGQNKDPAAADALFRLGREAMKKGDYATACPKLAASQRLEPAAGTVLNLAQCEEKIGKFASSYQHYQDALEQLPPDDPRVRVARNGLESTKPRVPKLTVKLAPNAPPGTRVFRDDIELDAATLGTPLPVDPGEHAVTTKAPGRRDHNASVSVGEAESKELIAVAGSPGNDSDDSAPTKSTPKEMTGSPDQASGDSTQYPGSTQRTIGYVTGAVGILGLGLGGYYAWRAKGLNDQATTVEHFHDDPGYPTGSYCDAVCHDKTQDSRAASKVAYGMFIGGGVLVASGVAIILLAPSARSGTSKSATSVSASVSPSMAGLQMGGTW